MAIDTLGAFTLLAFASAGFCGGVVFGGARVASLRARHARLVRGVRLALRHLEMGHCKTVVMNTLTDALDKDRAIAIAIQEDPHSEPAGDFPATEHIRVHAVGDRHD